jgi:hypothetical protein
MPRAKSPSKKVRAPSPVRKVEAFVNDVDLEPTKEVFMVMHGFSLLLLMFALAATICWIYYIAKAIDNNAIGGSAGRGNDDTNGTLDASEDTTAGETRQVDTIKTMFQGVVASSLLYFVARHHYRSHY